VVREFPACPANAVTCLEDPVSLSTHVLDASRGCPAGGVPVELFCLDGGGWRRLGGGTTDPDGRLGDFGENATDLAAGTYRLVFDTAAYFAATGQRGFYPEVSVTFDYADPAAHYHVPLLLSPFAYSTYRGS
jgi:5-hydroxyisourate hydrolase